MSDSSKTNDPGNSTALLGEALLGAIRQAVREEIRVVKGNGQSEQLLTPEELANHLKVPLSWVYEQSRQRKIPTHRIGRYIRFDLHEVLNSGAAKTKSA